MDQSTNTDQPDADGILLHGPIELALAQTTCWKCKKETQVAALIAADLDEAEEGEPTDMLGAATFVHGITEDDMPAALAQAIEAVAPNYRPIFSGTLQETTWANACEHCEALQGAFYMHMEPDGPFFGRPGDYEGKRVALSPEGISVSGFEYSR